MYKLDFYTQYRQFFVADQTSTKNTSANDFWTEEAHEDRLGLGMGILGVGIECYGQVRGELDILDTCITKIDSSLFDHIVEGGLNVESGVIQVLDCPNFNVELEVKVKPGNYRARVYSSKLNTVHGDEGEDYYRIEIWPDEDMNRKVIKKFIRQQE
ncbi:MAG TPA: hypothetical protein VK543_15360 [Puia sp.]|nr:hypothetical protein [Puia sp.]